jgi:putative peptidoglycan lipid II flippase
MHSHRRIVKIGLFLAAATVLCRVISVGKEAYVAAVFGAGPITDAYVWAMLIPAIGMSLFVNAVRRIFLSSYPHYQAQGIQAAESYVNQFLSSLLLAAIGLAALAAGVLPRLWPLFVPHDNPSVVALSQQLLLPAAWMIVPMAAVAGLSAVFNAQGRFSSPQLTSVIPTLCVVGTVAVFGRTGGAMSLLVSLLAGLTLQACILLMMAVRTGHRLRWEFDRRSEVLLRLWSIAVPLFCLDLLSQGNVYVDRMMAGMLAPGKIAVLAWAGLIKDLISGTLIASFLMVLLPHSAQQVAVGATDELRRSCALVLRYAAILLFPLSALLVVCVPALFRHLQLGQMDEPALMSLALCLAAYGLGLFTDLASTSLYQALLALGKLRTLLLLGLFVNFLPNILLNLLLMRPFGEVGLALSTSLVGYSTLTANYLVLRRCIGTYEEPKTVGVICGALAAALALAAVGFGVLELVRHYRSDVIGDLLGVVAAAVVGTTVYATLLLVYPGSDDARGAFRLVCGKLQSLRAAVPW